MGTSQCPGHTCPYFDPAMERIIKTLPFAKIQWLLKICKRKGGSRVRVLHNLRTSHLLNMVQMYRILRTTNNILRVSSGSQEVWTEHWINIVGLPFTFCGFGVEDCLTQQKHVPCSSIGSLNNLEHLYQ